MADWYDEGLELLLKEVSEETEVPPELVKLVYSYLYEIDIIDYDIEKEIIRERYFDEDEE